MIRPPAVAMALLTLLAACAPLSSDWKPTKLHSQGEAGEVLLMVTSVTPWSQIADALQPEFKLKGNDAYSSILPVSQRLTRQALQALGISAAAGLPGTATTGAVVRATPANGAITVDGTVTNTVTPGTIATQTPTLPAGAVLPSLTSGADDPAVDPLLRYQAARSLFEAVTMMDREVLNAAVRACYVPYLIRLRLTVQSKLPALDYNLHTRVAFFVRGERQSRSYEPQGCKYAGKHAPIVVPLVASDDIERAITQQANAVARQIGIALNGMIHGIGLGAATSNLDQVQEGILGQDYNTRLSVARETDNVLSVRINATMQGINKRALVDQPYEVATVLLVPRGYFPEANIISSDKSKPVEVEVSSDTEFLDAETGARVPQTPGRDILKQVDEAIVGALRDTSARKILKEAWYRIDPGLRRRLGEMLAKQVQQGQIGDFGNYLKCADRELEHSFLKNGLHFVEEKLGDESGPPPFFLDVTCPIDEALVTKRPPLKPRVPENGNRGYLSACDGIDCGYYLNGPLLWTRLSGLLGNAAQQTSIAQLKLPSGLRVPDQTAILNDDGEHAVLELYDVDGDTVTGLLAKLILPARGRDIVQVSGRMEIDQVGHIAKVIFPTMSRLVSPPNGKALASLQIMQPNNCPAELLCTHVNNIHVNVLIAKPQIARSGDKATDKPVSKPGTPAASQATLSLSIPQTTLTVSTGTGK
jgi:hypothetical protein